MLISPYTWAGETVALHVHVWVAVILGAVIVSLPVALTLLRPAAAMTRHAVAIGQMLMSVLLIHLGAAGSRFISTSSCRWRSWRFIATGRC